MDFRVPSVKQTPWACGHNGEVWSACVYSDIEDEAVVDRAKRLVDGALPQKLSTFFGGYHHSFLTREYLLNLLLFYYQEHGLFPKGAVCIVDKWVWEGSWVRRGGKWWQFWAWRWPNRSELRAPGYWGHLQNLGQSPSSHDGNTVNSSALGASPACLDS